MAIESTGHEGGNPRMFALVEDSPKEGPTPTVWAWPQFIDFLKVSGSPCKDRGRRIKSRVQTPMRTHSLSPCATRSPEARAPRPQPLKN